MKERMFKKIFKHKNKILNLSKINKNNNHFKIKFITNFTNKVIKFCLQFKIKILINRPLETLRSNGSHKIQDMDLNISLHKFYPKNK
jgi:hypothetical protein